MSDDYGHEVRRLETRTSSVESDLYSLRSKLGEVDDLDHELRGIRSEIGSVEDDVNSVRSDLSELDDDVRSHIRDTEQALKRLTGRIQALEAHLLAARGAPQADLDTIDPEWRKLARAANHGWHVRTGLLSDHQREAHHRRIREYEGAIEERDEHRGKVVEAAGILAGTPRTSREFKQAVMDFGMSRALAESHEQRARKLADAAKAAQAALAQDEVLRRAKASLIERGEKAQKKLEWLLHGRLVEAVAMRALLPMWFVTVLGPVPPAEKTQEWMDLATQVMVYRVTYEVTDQVVALGPEPADYAPRRTTWHHELTRALRRW
ncbi:hypothetical protein AB0K09_31850 [Streptomyces sp. NPDC049577]|uniref:hypothetical protein n=1 Tax=Streptomyces sp. NPDC049577 TaxID=3155153 RepID=UPI00344A9283